jgi:nicotinamide-nucleotide amidase
MIEFYDMRNMVYVKAEELVALAKKAGLRLAAAESCTGGLVAAALTDIAGSSTVFERGFVTYSNESKVEMIGVAPQTLAAHGAVSAPTAREMAEGALARSRADLAVAITGIAGPGGGSAEKPVGLVHFACARRGGETVLRERRFGPLSRSEIRTLATLEALALLRAGVTGED